jgi:hypothetical protein
MLTGMLAVRNLTLGEQHDLWSVNTDQEYHEEIRDAAVVDEEAVVEALQEALARAFPKLDRMAFGLALGAVAGLLLGLATLILVLKGGDVVGPKLGLLSHYFPGYRVTLAGSGFGLVYGFTCAFIGGWLFAFARNLVVFLYMALTQRRVERQLLRRLLGYL